MLVIVDLISLHIESSLWKCAMESYLRVQRWQFHCYTSGQDFAADNFRLYRVQYRTLVSIVDFWIWAGIRLWVFVARGKAICDDNFASGDERNMPFIRAGIKPLKWNCCRGSLFEYSPQTTLVHLVTLCYKRIEWYLLHRFIWKKKCLFEIRVVLSISILKSAVKIYFS